MSNVNAVAGIAQNPLLGDVLFNRMGRFAVSTFPDAPPAEHLLKLQKEAEEAQNEPTDATEYADCLLALFGAAYKAGFSFLELLRVADEKLTVCECRKWVRQADGTYQHIA